MKYINFEYKHETLGTLFVEAEVDYISPVTDRHSATCKADTEGELLCDYLVVTDKTGQTLEGIDIPDKVLIKELQIAVQFECETDTESLTGIDPFGLYD